MPISKEKDFDPDFKFNIGNLVYVQTRTFLENIIKTNKNSYYGAKIPESVVSIPYIYPNYSPTYTPHPYVTTTGTVSGNSLYVYPTMITGTSNAVNLNPSIPTPYIGTVATPQPVVQKNYNSITNLLSETSAWGYKSIDDFFYGNSAQIKQEEKWSDAEIKMFGKIIPNKPFIGLIVDRYVFATKTENGELVKKEIPNMYKILIGDKNCLWFVEEDISLLTSKKEKS